MSESMSDQSVGNDYDSPSETESAIQAGLQKMMQLLGSEAGSELDVTSEEEDESDEEDGAQQAAAAAVALKNAQSTAMDRITAKFKVSHRYPFFDTQTLTFPFALEIPDPGNDLARELQFYKQSLWAANEARNLFSAEKKPFFRPDDFFAEMVKSDTHMERIRTKLLDEAAGIEKSEQAKKLRLAKKFGKSVQVAKIQERQKEKKALNDKVKEFRKKRKGDTNADGDDNDEFDVSLDQNPAKRQRLDNKDKPRMRRDARDKKFGRPTSSKRPKENTRESTNDLFSKPKKGGGGRTKSVGSSRKKGSAPRPGKSKRQSRR